jgi:hypothetical protein
VRPSGPGEISVLNLRHRNNLARANIKRMPEQSHAVRNGVICACVPAALLLVSWPVAEMGFIDDWSYVKTAFVFARTGHIVYNGWATAMLGWAIPWAALFIKLFGFSFTAVRLSTLPLAMASVYLFHASLIRFGITARNAIVGALTLGLSPLFLPLAASYMTDVAGLFCILLCLYLCQRALVAHSDRTTILWLTCAALTNIAGGTVRQIAWLGTLVMVPSTAWLLRKRAGVIQVAFLLWIVSVVSVLACIRWFERQPYAVPEKIIQGPVTGTILGHMLAEMLKALLCLMLVTFPILAAWIPVYRSLTGGAKTRIACILAAMFAASIVLGFRGSLEHRVMPWLGHIIGTLSIFSSTGEMLGSRPVTLTLPTRVVLSLLVIGAALTLVEQLLARARRREGPGSVSLHEAKWVLGPFVAGYTTFLLPRAMYSFVYDRYLLGLMPFAIIVLLLLYQRWVAGRLPNETIVVLCLFGLYTTAGTHDWFALNRARVAAVAQIHASGVPTTSIQGGFDYDGWTQIEAAGYINDARIVNPPNVYKPSMEHLKLPSQCQLGFAPYTPAIHPKYFVVFSVMPCLQASKYEPLTYSTWLPPFHRTIFIQEAPQK